MAAAQTGASAPPGYSCRPVDIEEFYDADPRRRASAELELGSDWHDALGVRYELSWVEDTGELYAMREPVPAEWATPFGGIHARGSHSTDEREIAGMTVQVIAEVPSRVQLDKILEGWERAEPQPDSISWLVSRLGAAGLLPVTGDPALEIVPGAKGAAGTEGEAGTEGTEGVAHAAGEAGAAGPTPR